MDDSQKTYWLIPMNYRYCNFELLKSEINEHGKIMWQAPGTPRKNKDGEYELNSEMAEKLKQGHIVYFYVTNLPSNMLGLSRILLRGVILDPPKPMQKNNVWLDSSEDKMINGFSVESITTLNTELLEDNDYLSYSSLCNNEKYKKYDFINPQGDKRWPNTINGNFKIDLIKEILEPEFTRNQENDFDLLIAHFTRKCFFCRRGNKGDHSTFLGRNGLYYYEYHHFIPQSQIKNHPKLKMKVYSPYNGLFLCSNCHNMIHYGTSQAIADMLQYVIDSNDDGIKKLLDEDFEDAIGTSDIIGWFKEVYNVK